MVVTGDVRSFPGRVRVTGTGSGQWDGWQIVARYPSSLLQSGTGHYAFLVRGIVGEVSPRVGPVVLTRMEVTVAEGAASGGGIDRILRSHIVRLPARDARFLRFQHGIPFGFIVVIDDNLRQPGLRVDPDIGTTWQQGRDLLVIARSFRNGDPVSVEISWSVADVWIMHWDLQRVPTSHVVVRDFAPTPPAVVNADPTVLHSEWLPPPATGELWLYWHWIRYSPNVPDTAPWFAVLYQEDGSVQFPIVGLARLGHAARGLGGWGSLENDLSALVFRPVPRLAGLGITLSLRGSSGRGPSFDPNTEVFQWRLFGIRLDPGVSCFYPEAFYEDSEPVLCRPGGENVAWLWERPAQDRVANLVAVFQASPAWLFPLTSNHEAYLTDEALQVYRGPTVHGVSEGPAGEGQHCLIVTRRPRHNVDHRWRLYMWQVAGSQPMTAADAADLVGVEWTFETNPSNEPLLGPQPPAPLVLVPDREALATNYLQAPPHDVYDADGWEEDPVDNQARFEADSGVLRTWPTFLGVKSVWRFTRTGLTRDQRDELVAFFQANTNFRTRLPRRKVETACKVIDRPHATDAGGVYTLTLRAVELIHVGGRP